MSSNSGVEENCTGNTILNDNVWHNVSITYNNGILKHYIDGVLDNLGVSSSLSLSELVIKSPLAELAGKINATILRLYWKFTKWSCYTSIFLFCISK